MKIARILIGLLFFCACQQEKTTIDPVTGELVDVSEICYDPNNDVTDSLKEVYYEILDKQESYNASKFDKKLEDWQGKSISFKQLPITSIDMENEYLSPRISVLFGSFPKPFNIDTRIDISMNFESNDDLTRFEIGQKINFKGVILLGSAGRHNYGITMACQEID